MRCPNCGARMNKQAGVCLKCGTKLSQIQTASHQAVKQARAEYEPEKVVYTTMWPKDLSCRNTLLFCIFLGLFGAHYFYVKRPIPGTIFCVGWSIFLLFYIIAASLTYGKEGILHGAKCLLLQNDDGTIAPAYSVASGLDYPGSGPKHCYLKEIKRVEYKTVDDIEAIDAFYELSKTEGIIPALESAHAVAFAIKYSKENKNKKILVNLSGRGDKDVEFVLKNYKKADI